MSDKIQTSTIKQVNHSMRIYKDNLPVYISVFGKEYPIDDIFLTLGEKGDCPSIIIETWEKNETTKS